MTPSLLLTKSGMILGLESKLWLAKMEMTGASQRGSVPPSSTSATEEWYLGTYRQQNCARKRKKYQRKFIQLETQTDGEQRGQRVGNSYGVRGNTGGGYNSWFTKPGGGGGQWRLKYPAQCVHLAPLDTKTETFDCRDV